MDRFNQLTSGEKIVGVSAVVLLIDLLLLPWHSIDLIIGSVSRTGLQSPNALWGWLAFLAAAGMLAQIVLSRFTSVKLPDPPVPWPTAHMIGGIAAFVLLLLKLLVETTFLGFGAFVGVVAAGVLAYGGVQMHRTLSESPPAPMPGDG